MAIDKRKNVPKDGVKQILYGEGLKIGPGRGIEGGIPYGEQLQKERDEVQKMHGFRPGVAAKVRAATRRALGRA
jgi:hypothetical protein